uniref:TraK protein n=1 Tax=Klebsiella pneumoniae TaxID=573 RepID=A0A2P1BNN1_KLEPN|nr:TraK protein [Klebsiella pneumoniae]
MRQGSVPDEYQSVPVTSEVLQVPAGLRATADRVWVGHHLKVVRYSLDNVSCRPVWCVKAISGSPEHVPSCSVPGGPADCRWSHADLGHDVR